MPCEWYGIPGYFHLPGLSIEEIAYLHRNHITMLTRYFPNQETVFMVEKKKKAYLHARLNICPIRQDTKKT